MNGWQRVMQNDIRATTYERAWEIPSFDSERPDRDVGGEPLSSGGRCWGCEAQRQTVFCLACATRLWVGIDGLLGFSLGEIA